MALKRGLEKYGLNVAASRLTTGNHVLYDELEDSLAAFFGTKTCTLAPTGYLSNLIVAQALSGNFSHVLVDKASHPSLNTAAQSMNCPVLQFEHRNPDDVERCVRRCGPGSRIILLTDGMFSRNGGVAPLDQYRNRLPKDAWILVDDAHGAGVLGKTGRGTLEQTGVSRRHIVQTITLSKAFGVYGGAILGEPSLREKILKRSYTLAGSTPLPLPLIAASLESVKLLKNGANLRKRLASNTAYIKDGLKPTGIISPGLSGPIIMWAPKRRAEIATLKKKLLSAKIYPPFIVYPGGPPLGYFRFTLSSEHTRRQLDTLITVLADFLRKR
jgi:8-amino-7-oxononanoate synthase